MKLIEAETFADAKSGCRPLFGRGVRTFIMAFVGASAILFALSSIVRANPKIEDVFRSTQENLGQSGDSAQVLVLLCCGGGLILFIVLAHRWWSGRSRPRILNHQGKLMREMQREISLKSVEIRQLKTLAEGNSIENPLTLLLCPSVLAKAVKAKPDRVDRKALGALLKRVGAR